MTRPKFLRALVAVVGVTCLILTPEASLPSGLGRISANSESEASSKVYLPLVASDYTPPIIPDTTHPLTEETTQHLVSVSEDGEVFTFDEMTPELEAVETRHVMVGGVSTAAPDGFLRTVTAVSTEDGQVRVETEQATLEDAIEQGGFSISRQLTPADVQGGYMAPGVSLQAGSNLPNAFFFEIEDVVLYDHDGNRNTTDDQVNANGSLELAPTFDFGLLVEHWTLQRMEVVLRADEVADLEIVAEAEIIGLEARIEIARLYLGTMTVFVGVVPVVIVLDMPVYLCADGKVTVGITAGVTQQARLSAGVRYENEDWTLIAALDNSFVFTRPRLTAGADLKAYVDPLLRFRLYGVAGPWVAARPYLELEADVFADPWWELYAGLEAPVGVEVEVLGRSLAKYEGVAIAYRVLLAQADSAGTTTRVSVASDGTQGNGWSGYPSPSADGRYVAFHSWASNLVPGDTNGYLDVFVHDRATGQTTRVSVASDGAQLNSYSEYPSLSADGRYVAFDSWANTPVSGDTNGTWDVFVHDRTTGQTTRVSVATDGGQANGNSYYPSLSADGRHVAFSSFASNLVSGDTNGQVDVFVHDRGTGRTTRVSVATDGAQGNGFSYSPSLSADGRYAAFASSASNLAPDDTNGFADAFVHDRVTAQTTRVSLATDGAQGNGDSYGHPISADGRYVAFDSLASNLVSGDTNGLEDVFVHDRGTGQTARVSVASDGTQGNSWSYLPSLSADGRYVGFMSNASNLVPGDTNGYEDVFLHDRVTGQTTRVSVASDGTQGDWISLEPSISADGRYVAFTCWASNLVPGDTNGEGDIFVHDRGVLGAS